MHSQHSFYRESNNDLHQGYNCIGVTENAHFQNDEARYGYKPRTLVDRTLELLDPTPNIHTLFMQFNKRFFSDVLSSVQVKWSNRMTSCAGVCTFHPRNRECIISLSVPLLKLRPRSDVVETLLHEMIHGYLFLTNNNRDRDGHGPEFCKHMERINKIAGTNITIYHSFHAEVRANQHHWWRCTGPCKNRKPFFGMVCRSMNRAPGPADFWYKSHQKTCGGTFIKVKEPENYKAKTNSKAKKNQNVQSQPAKNVNRHISDWFKKPEPASTPKFTSTPKHSVSADNYRIVNGKTNNVTPKNVTNKLCNWTKNGQSSPKASVSPRFSCSGTLGGSNSGKSNLLTKFDALVKNSNNELDSGNSQSNSTNIVTLNSTEFVDCPVCNSYVRFSIINEHIDLCLAKRNSSLQTESEEKLDNVFKETSVSDSLELKDGGNSFTQKRKTNADVNSNKKPKLHIPENEKILKLSNSDENIKFIDSTKHFNKRFPASPEQQNKSVVIVEDLDCDTSNNSSIISISSTSSSELHSNSHSESFETSGNYNINGTDKVKCIVCGIMLTSKPLLNAHLNECIGGILEDEFVPNDASSEGILKNSTAKNDMYPCPHCAKIIEISIMNEHLDACLIE